jgi:hypothetical protein
LTITPALRVHVVHAGEPGLGAWVAR